MAMETTIAAKLSGELASLSYWEAEILSLVGDKRNLLLEEVSPRIEEVRNLISSCHLTLLVVEYPWGVQFELGLSKKGAEYLAESQKIKDNSALTQEAKAA